MLNLNLSDNSLGPEGVNYICNMLKENCYITDLVSILRFYLVFLLFSLSVYNLQTTKYRTTPQGAWKYIATLWRLRITSKLKLQTHK